MDEEKIAEEKNSRLERRIKTSKLTMAAYKNMAREEKIFKAHLAVLQKTELVLSKIDPVLPWVESMRRFSETFRFTLPDNMLTTLKIAQSGIAQTAIKITELLKPLQATWAQQSIEFVKSIRDIQLSWQKQFEWTKNLHFSFNVSRLFSPIIRILEKDRRALILLPHELALRAFEEGDKESINLYLLHYCDIKSPSEEVYLILWRVLRKGDWRQAKDPARYIKTTVWRWIKFQLGGEKNEKGRFISLYKDFKQHKLALIDLSFREQEGTPNAIETIACTTDGGIEAVEARLTIEKILEYVKDPNDRRALLLYAYGAAETLQEAYGSVYKKDSGQRRIRKQREQLRKIIFE